MCSRARRPSKQQPHKAPPHPSRSPPICTNLGATDSALTKRLQVIRVNNRVSAHLKACKHSHVFASHTRTVASEDAEMTCGVFASVDESVAKRYAGVKCDGAPYLYGQDGHQPRPAY